MTASDFGRTHQCKECPWKLTSNPAAIPGGYNAEKHRRLTSCGPSGRAMACHESKVGEDQACVGWLLNQLGPGNNIRLRMLAIRGAFDVRALVLDGDQHETLEAMCATAVGTEDM